MPPPAAGLCHDGECFDEALLAGLDERLAALPAERRARGVLLVLHQMGSHGPAYCKRSPPGRKPFLPECTTNVLQQCDRQAIVNAYDNTIAYTDHVLAGAIDWLGRQSAQYDAGAALRLRPRRVAGREQPLPARPAVRASRRANRSTCR